jgi:PPP family 3-phenylpropionic acid transporter
MNSSTKLKILSLSCFFNLGAFNLFSTFITIYLKNCGLNESQIGTIGAWATCFSILMTPLIGHLADRFQAVKPMAFIIILVHALTSLLYIFARGYFHFLGLGMLRGITYASTSMLIPVVVLSILPKDNRAKHYSSYRKWGSVGYFSFAVAGGYFAENFGIPRLFLGAAFFFIIAALLFNTVKTDTALKKKPKHNLFKVFSQHRMVMLFAALVPFGIWGPICFRFLPLYMREIGGSYTLVGYLMGSMGLLGIIGLPIVGRLADRFGVNKILALNFLIIPARLALYPLIENPYWIFIPNIIHLFTFPINEVCLLLYVERYCIPEMRNTALGLVTTFRHIGGIAGSFFGGYWAYHLGYPHMFYLASIISGLAFIIFITGLRINRNK